MSMADEKKKEVTKKNEVQVQREEEKKRKNKTFARVTKDPKHKAENLISGNGIWLCSPKEHPSNIKAEFQLQKATTIDYIDIGNHNSAMVCIEVGMSTWPSTQNFVSLLPTLVLMSPADCRTGLNSKSVRMFKRENLVQENVIKKWDRIRVICTQPFIKNAQFGLAFLKLRSLEEKVDEIEFHDLSEMKKKREAMFSSLVQKSSSPSQMSKSLQSLEINRATVDESEPVRCVTTPHQVKKLSSPISRAARLVMAHQHVQNEDDFKKQKKELECEALTFLISMNLTNEDIHSLKVSHIREEFEIRRKKKMSTREKLIFKNIALDYASERLNRMEKEETDVTPLSLSSDDELENMPSRSTCKTTPFRSQSYSLGRSEEQKKRTNQNTPSRNCVALMDSIVASPETLRRKRCLILDEEANSRKVTTSKKMKSNDVSKALDVHDSSQSEVCFDLVDLSPTKDEANKKSKPIDLVECPLCTELFTSTTVAEHASNCNGPDITETMEPYVQSSSMEECPVCGDVVESEKLRQHTEACAEQNFE